jgi:hypothetical protein
VAHAAARVTTAACLSGALACAPDDLPLPNPDAHRAEVEAWQARRDAELREPEGWLSVTGLFWLEEGESSFGSDPANPVVFPGAEVPPRAGTFFREGDVVRMEVAPGVRITRDDEPVTSVVLASDHSQQATMVRMGSLLWHVIERQHLVGIRLKDTASAARFAFQGVPSFPTSREWVIPARFDRYARPRTITVPNVLGMATEEESPGALVFRVGGETLRLDVTGSPDSPTYFVVFGDRTNGSETYGGGRFLYVAAPDQSGRTLIDFNKAHNPPCVFTPYATCPLPPRQNILPVRIEAGEKDYHK